ncbi:type VI secretion system Vgr family protein [Paraburkholderia bryophila]|uniref:Type VI secretion system VgrG family protein n=1 Tax=Paraburkholderia bryophila TaxID=420952 RepID=A0A7Y9WUB1_9BURK|nr:type VI secretion system tip protein TssI/VgrG [Paraburkholderia bryophila]NYH27284.1 type VI secretion system VgrG family protein [Paraburkholderia bryophila]
MKLTDLIQAIRSDLIQHERLLKTDIPSLPANTLLPRRAVTVAELGRDFSVTIDMVSVDSDIELKTLMSQPMTLWIQQADKSYLPINGYVHRFRRLGTNGDLTSYQISFASWLHFLRLRSDMRIWQDRSVDDIISDVFNEHPQAQGKFIFALSRSLPLLSYCRQSETDWNFVHRLMESEGLYGFFRYSADGQSHTFVITDDLRYVDEISPVRYYGSDIRGSDVDALTLWSGSRTLQSAAYATRTSDYKNPPIPARPKGTLVHARPNQGALPSQTEIFEYTGSYTYRDSERGHALSKIRVEEWESRAKRFHGVGGLPGIDAGRVFQLVDHPEHDREPEEQRKFVALKVWRYLENNLPVSRQEPDYPHSLKRELKQAMAGRADDESLKIRHFDGSEGCSLVEIEAQRTTVPYRSPFEHKKPVMHLETAIVVGPKGEEVYTDELNRIKVVFLWDRHNPGNAGASCWIRAAQADTGAGYGGVHVPRVGEELIIDHVGGDCDRPLAVHRVYNGAVRPAWHTNGILSGYRSKEYHGSDFSHFVMDDATGQTRAQLLNSGSNGITLLQIGYLIDQSGNTRGDYLGSGFDLKTDAWGAIRANRGLYLSTYAKPSGSQPLDARETQEQLGNSASLLKTLADASEQIQAESLKPGHQELKDFSDATRHSVSGTSKGGRTAGGGTGNANVFAKPLLALGSPEHIGFSSKASIHTTADRHINLASGLSTVVAAGKSFIAGAVEKISLFAQRSGIDLFAAKGPVRIQAHDDDIELIAERVIKLLAIKGKVDIAALDGIRLSSGEGYIELAGGDVNIQAPGKISFKGSQYSFEGPGGESYLLPMFRPPYQAQYVLENATDGAPMIHHPYELKLPSGRTLLGRTNYLGETVLVFTSSAQDVHLRALEQDSAEVKPWTFAGGGQADIEADYVGDTGND